MKCYYVKLLAIYAKRIIYGYKCDIEQLRKDIEDAYVFSLVEDYINECDVHGTFIDDRNKFLRKLISTYNNICRDCT
jgi:hypothetical protein